MIFSPLTVVITNSTFAVLVKQQFLPLAYIVTMDTYGHLPISDLRIEVCVLSWDGGHYSVHFSLRRRTRQLTRIQNFVEVGFQLLPLRHIPIFERCCAWGAKKGMWLVGRASNVQPHAPECACARHIRNSSITMLLLRINICPSYCTELPMFILIAWSTISPTSLMLQLLLLIYWHTSIGRCSTPCRVSNKSAGTTKLWTPVSGKCKCFWSRSCASLCLHSNSACNPEMNLWCKIVWFQRLKRLRCPITPYSIQTFHFLDMSRTECYERVQNRCVGRPTSPLPTS